ncbi:MAG: FixH family protein [Anaerolineae bacterium]|nr:FixH family protein [Anaerolineae bacterium]
MRKIALVLLLCATAILATGCDRQSAQPTATPDPGIQITVESLNEPQRVGEVTLVVTVRDAAGAPIEDAKIDLRGDMSHAGMTPSLGSVEDGQDGRYSVPFNWTMGGDWFLDVTVTLPDGRSTTRRFDLTVNAS